MKRFYFVILAFLMVAISLNAKEFTLVVDAGHGGEDPGAVGTKIQEKELNLKVALLVGEKVQQKCSDVKIVYTRNTDKTVALKDRPLIANKANGDFFISIHTNANDNKKACGTETYIIGLDKTKANFEVAKRENAVILLEKDKESYKGFNPNSPESYIMFELMQDLYADQSLQMADLIQKSFNRLTDRSDRGVRQGPFWVLHQTKMPSVLVEMGFVSNSEDQAYLMTKEGQNKIAESIAQAFEAYKRDYDKKNGKATVTEEKKEPAVNTNLGGKKEGDKKPVMKVKVDSVVLKPLVKTDSVEVSKMEGGKSVCFKVQLFVASSVLKENDPIMKGMKDLEYYEENGLVKYTSRCVEEYQEAVVLQKELRESFPDCFMVAFNDGKKIGVKEACILLDK